jgi:hypothetical protein
MADRSVLWVYGVLDGDPPGPPRGLGVDDQPVELVRADGVAALVSRVPCPRFDTHGLCRSLQRRRTFEALVRAHQDVLRDALALGAVVPFGFATVLKNEAAVRALVKRDRGRLAGTQLVWTLAREIDANGIALELTGPWPAFHFSQT